MTSPAVFFRILATSLVWALVSAEERYIEDTDRFPGWKGELPSDTVAKASEALSQTATGKTIGFGENGKVAYVRPALSTSEDGGIVLRCF